jgi:hypothetical protein
MVVITDDALYATYPPIILAGRGEGTLDAVSGSRVLLINNAAVTLGENLTLAGGYDTGGHGGGGVYVETGTFTMSGGTISGNSASGGTIAFGGGVYVTNNGTFTKTGDSIIYGGNAAAPLKNTAAYGYAAYASGEKRNATAGKGVGLDSAKTGQEGGWE